MNVSGEAGVEEGDVYVCDVYVYDVCMHMPMQYNI